MLRSQAARYEAVREVRQSLAGHAPLARPARRALRAGRGAVGGGIATLYLTTRTRASCASRRPRSSAAGSAATTAMPLGQGVDGGAAAAPDAVVPGGPDGGLAYASLPLLAGDDLVGVLSVQGGPDGARAALARSRAAQETLLEIAAAAADAIGQAAREERMSARATQVSAINEAGLRHRLGPRPGRGGAPRDLVGRAHPRRRPRGAAAPGPGDPALRDPLLLRLGRRPPRGEALPARQARLDRGAAPPRAASCCASSRRTRRRCARRLRRR